MIKWKKNPNSGLLTNARAKAQATNDSEESIDIPDTGPSHPNWLYPKVVDGLLVTGDEHERELVERLLHACYHSLGCLELAVHSKEGLKAKSHFNSALVLAKGGAKAARNLVAHRCKGLQYVTKIVVKGPSLGLGAKIQQSLNPAKDTPEARLAEEVRDVASTFEQVSERFITEARLIERFQPGPVDRDFAKVRGDYLPTLGDAKIFRALSVRALATAIELDEVVINLSRSRRQTMVVEDPSASVVPMVDEKSEPAGKSRDAA